MSPFPAPHRPSPRPVRRRSVLALGGALAAAGTGALAGCSSSDGAGSDSGRLTVWGWGDPVKGMKAAVPAFEKANAGTTVDVQDVGNPAIWDKITTGMAAGGAGLPDVMDIGADYMGNYLETFPDGFADLSALGADDLKSDFPAGLWGTGANADGKQFGIPFEVNTSLVYYRTDLFEQAGVRMEDIATWDDLLQAGTTVKRATGADLFALDKAASQADAANFWQMLARLQGTFFFDEHGDIAFSGAEGVRALDFLRRANDAGVVVDIPMSQGTTSQVKGQTPVAILPAASWLTATFAKDAPEMQGKWGIRRPPAVTPGGYTSASAGGTFLAVSGTSANKEKAWEFVKFSMATLEGQQLVYQGGGLFPSFRPMYDTDAFKAPNDYFGGTDTNQLTIDALAEDTPPDHFTKDYAKALKAYDDAQTQVLVSGADPGKALAGAAELLAQQTGREVAG